MPLTRRKYYEHLRTAAYDGTFPCIDKYGTCRYRNDEGTKACAVGILIPDSAVDTDLESNGLVNILKDNILIPNHISDEALGDIQSWHDQLSDLWDPVSFLKQCAQALDLKGVTPLRPRNLASRSASLLALRQTPPA